MAHAGDGFAFHAEAEGRSQIVISGLDGRNRRVLTHGAGLRYSPRWSPDDRWIPFTMSIDGGQYDIQAVRVDDGAGVDLAATPEDEREGEWAPAR